MAGAPEPGIGRAVALPALVAAVVLGVLGLFLSTFLGDASTLVGGLVIAWIAFAGGRLLAHVDRPRGYALFARHLLTGVAVGFVGWTLLRGIFRQGPAEWAILGGFGLGLYRGHRALLRAAETDDGRRWMRVFRPKDLQALGVLAVGYALVGVSGYFILRTLFGFLPLPILGIATAAYALHGARLLLGFASEERAGAGAGVVGWIKANALQAGVFALVLVAYALFRRQLAATVPFFTLVEFGLGVAVFGFVLARLRSKMKKEGSELATASRARDHERVISEIREGTFDEVARPVTRFIESGFGKDEYARALTRSLPEGDARAEALTATLRAHREPARPPPLALEWALAAGAAMTLGVAIASLVLAASVFHAEAPFPILVAVLFLAFGGYAQQDVARAHHRPWLAAAIAGGGTALLFVDFLFFAGAIGVLGAIPAFVWWCVAIIVAAMLGVPAYSAYRQDQRLRAGTEVDARRLAPSLEMQRELQKARKRAATSALAAFVILLPAPWLAGWLAERSIIPSDFPAFFDDLLGVAIWIAAAFGSAALVRFYGLTRGRPALLAREKEKRERRLALHRTMMQSIERT